MSFYSHGDIYLSNAVDIVESFNLELVLKLLYWPDVVFVLDEYLSFVYEIVLIMYKKVIKKMRLMKGFWQKTCTK